MLQEIVNGSHENEINEPIYKTEHSIFFPFIVNRMYYHWVSQKFFPVILNLQDDPHPSGHYYINAVIFKLSFSTVPSMIVDVFLYWTNFFCHNNLQQVFSCNVLKLKLIDDSGLIVLMQAIYKKRLTVLNYDHWLKVHYRI